MFTRGNGFAAAWPCRMQGSRGEIENGSRSVGAATVCGLTALLPREQTTMTREMFAELEFLFGQDGAMPALRVR
jgi:hypothetical protein